MTSKTRISPCSSHSYNSVLSQIRMVLNWEARQGHCKEGTFPGSEHIVDDWMLERRQECLDWRGECVPCLLTRLLRVYRRSCANGQGQHFWEELRAWLTPSLPCGAAEQCPMLVGQSHPLYWNLWSVLRSP